MNLYFRRWVTGGLLALCATVAFAQTDRFTADYKNYLNPYTNAVTALSFTAIGSGYNFVTNSVRPNYTSLNTYLTRGSVANLRSTIGAPITAISSNISLGEPMTPPDNWNGMEPDIENVGGMAVWIDFAKQVLTSQAGTVSVTWTLENGSTQEETYTISASPKKRPVRLYWTHERPASTYDSEFRPLQNAGPTVQFGSNYKVHLYGTSQIGIYNEASNTVGDVRLNGTELQAFENASGTFLIVYSRLDEALNKRVMLDYELVDVLEPTQTQIDVAIGEQLRPVLRNFDTTELFPQVTRGLTDESESGEIYVYQHGSGEQKNYLWAIRDSSTEPWKIEVFWRAKEALDVVWPFEVDIYSASWDKANAQVYVRNCESATGGEAQIHPKVYHAPTIVASAMDYQVPQKHVVIEDGAFYTNYADDDTFALLRFADGDRVWFQTVRSVPAKDTPLLTSLGMTFRDVATNATYWTDTENPIPPYYQLAAQLNPALAEEIRAPFAGEKGFFYPGYINRDYVRNEQQYQIKNPYNINLYQYPQAYTVTNELYAPIFPVNVGQLEIWWSLPSSLNSEPKPKSGHVEALAAPIFFPAVPVVYTIDMSSFVARWDEGGPQIVLASGRGSAGYGLNDRDPSGVESPATKIDQVYYYEDPNAGMGMMDPETGLPIEVLPTGPTKECVFKAPLNVTGGGASSAFTIETWLAPDEMMFATAEGVPLVSFYTRNSDGTVQTNAHLKIAIDITTANLYVNGTKRTSFAENPSPLFCDRNALGYYDSMFQLYDVSIENTRYHVALTRSKEGQWKYYVNGMPVAEFTIANDESYIHGSQDMMKLFEPMTLNDCNAAGREMFSGTFQHFRVWSVERKWQQISDNRYLQVPSNSSLLAQYSEQEFANPDMIEELTYGPLMGQLLQDSSGYGNHAEVSDGVYVTAGLFYGAPLKPKLGQTFNSNTQIYRQNDRELDGYNPNEEHALLIGDVVHALRCDLNQYPSEYDVDYQYTSPPYVLVQYADEDNPGRVKMTALRVVPENDMYRFRRFLDAGSMIQSPDPLARFQPANLQKFVDGPLYADTDECFKDRKGWYWAHQAGDQGGWEPYTFDLSYPCQESFDFVDGITVEPGTVLGWLTNYTGRDDSYFSNITTDFVGRSADDPLDSPLNYTYIVQWPDDVPNLYVNDTLVDAKNGLPAVRGQLSAQILYQQSMALTSNECVNLIDPTRVRYGSLPVLPDGVRNYRDAKTAKTKFSDLPPFLRDRFVWNPMGTYNLNAGITEELELTGTVIEEVSYTYLWLNTMDARSKAALTDPTITPGGDNPNWVAAINGMSSEPLVLTDDETPFDSIALATTGRGAGYVTLVFNDSTNDTMVPKSESVFMYVIRVMPELYNGDLHPIFSDNPLDKQMNMKYTADFNGKPEKWEFEWRYSEPINGDWNTDPNAWFTLANTMPGTPMLDWITIGDAGIFGLQDWYVRCRYRALDPTIQAVVGTEWSNWSTPCLAEGWIKRVLKAVNPFEQRIQEYYERQLNTELSMIQQVGAPYQGDIPLNMEALDDNGLLAIYETVLNQAKKLSINADYDATGALALALQMAAGRIAELNMVLGNEALADASNPTVDLGTDSPVSDGAESSIFPFMNQCGTLLDEELALLRGRDLSTAYNRSWTENIEPWEYPYYNRLQWNFTADVMGGQVAYVLNYGISDLKGDNDGQLDVNDAVALYPQGHGDAYGHYLSAIKGYYALLRHPNFGWRPQIEAILAGTVNITTSYLHEKRFALAAAAKAKTAEMVVSRTYRSNYEQGIEDAWMLAEDEVEGRYWGNDEWATRGHLGAYYDWLVVNALLPSRSAPDDSVMLRMIDRESTYEIGDIAASARRIQSTADHADSGLNPLGISDAAIPFDISPSEIDEGKTHFEQIYARAQRATSVAYDIFKRIKSVSNALRTQNEERDFDTMVADEEAAINRRLIEIYGYPYSDDIGAGKIYPQGYSGPDLIHYNYVETYDIDNSNTITGRYFDVTIDNYELITTNIVGTYQADIDLSAADYGWLGNIVHGAISLYQDGLAALSAKVDPYLKYGGISTAEKFKLPVTMIDTTGDHMDGKVDYEFSVAAWSNTVNIVSYYVAAYGFPGKPDTYHGQRRAEGEIQISLSGYAAQLSDIAAETENLYAVIKKLRGQIDELHAFDYSTQMGYVTAAAQAEVKAFNEAVEKNAKTIETVLNQLKDIKSILTDTSVEALPKMVGMATDVSSLGRAAILALKAGLQEALNDQINQQQEVVATVKSEAEKLQDALNKQFSTYLSNEDRLKKVAAIQETTHAVAAAVAKLEIVFNTANATRMKFAALEAEGDELQNERERLRIAWSSDLSTRRYRNMMYQIMRNDELQRYNEAFESAARYTYLAAKAYDYETGLLQSDSSNAAGRDFMSQIIRTRALGRFSDDTTKTPLGGGATGDPGLADVLYRMNENWQVLKTRLGFNNAQADIDSFSLRKELYRKNDDSLGDAAWKAVLEDCWVADLRTHPVFARYCQPMDPMRAVEPGFAIPFRTMITARKGLFGQDLDGGDTAFSSTYFATKIRGVGVWFDTGAGSTSTLPTRPEVYLIPAGLDYMRVPIKSSTSAQTTTRAWQVVDQVLPIPYPLSESQWETTDWSSLKDVFDNELCTTRKHPAVRGCVANAETGDSFVNYNARLIGRSVWNDQWWIFIPASSLNSDDATARQRFVDAVRDIHLNLKTYSLSGN